MKWRTVRTTVLVVLVLVLSVLAGIAVPALAMPAYAQGPQPEPQPYLYAMPKCSGLSLAQLEWAQQDYDTTYGWTHELVTDWQWRASFEARVNEFAVTIGCPQVLEDGQLTRWYKFYSPTYGRILRNVPQ